MQYFRPGLEESITLPPHPENSSEIGEVVNAVTTRTAEDVTSIRNHDHEPFYAVEKYCKSKGVEFDRKEMRELIKQATNIIGYFKGSFNRDRPVEVDSSINTLPSETNKSRSYPSGHATQSRLVARYMADRNPVHAEEILRAGNECGLGRVKAGFHYMSDYHMGNLLGEKLYIFMNRESDGS